MTTYIVRRANDVHVISTAAMRDNDIIIVHDNSSVFITPKCITGNDIDNIKDRVRRFLRRLGRHELPDIPLTDDGVYVDISHDSKELIGDLFDP